MSSSSFGPAFQIWNTLSIPRHKERRDILLDILDVDLDWRMHQISDGERRRVQVHSPHCPA